MRCRMLEESPDADVVATAPPFRPIGNVPRCDSLVQQRVVAHR